MPTMKSSQRGIVVSRLIMHAASLTLLFGLPFAFANHAVAAPTPEFVYVANLCNSSTVCTTGTVSAYAVDSSTGALREIAGSPFTAGIQSTGVAVDPSGRFAYVSNECDSCRKRANVSAYTIDSSTGALHAVAGSPFAAGREPVALTVDPLGRFAYVVNFDGGVSAYTINSSTGALRAVAGSPFATGVEPLSVTVHPSGRFAYVMSFSDSTVWAYTINSSTGALSVIAGSPFPTGKLPRSIAVDPLGRFVYVANDFDNTVSAYTVNSSTGALHAVAGSPFATGTYPYSVTVDPSGRFAYVVNAVDDTVSAYTINSSTGALHAVAGSPFPAGNGPQAVMVDPSGRFAYVANNNDFTVSAYAINSSTGALHAVGGSPFAGGIYPESVAIAAQANTTSALTLTPRALAFGNIKTGTSSAAKAITVTNTSAAAVAITGIALRGTAPGQFAFTDNCGKSLAGHASCTLNAMFKPTTVGAKTAFLDVNGGGGGRSVKLTGTGT
jgi:6-phosphogluconolactonase (cycloisomerase 2 family)